MPHAHIPALGEGRRILSLRPSQLYRETLSQKESNNNKTNIFNNERVIAVLIKYSLHNLIAMAKNHFHYFLLIVMNYRIVHRIS
jgi:hypothetical protein